MRDPEAQRRGPQVVAFVHHAVSSSLRAAVQPDWSALATHHRTVTEFSRAKEPLDICDGTRRAAPVVEDPEIRLAIREHRVGRLVGGAPERLRQVPLPYAVRGSEAEAMSVPYSHRKSRERLRIETPLPLRSATPAISAASAQPGCRRWPYDGESRPRGTGDRGPRRLKSRRNTA